MADVHPRPRVHTHVFAQNTNPTLLSSTISILEENIPYSITLHRRLTLFPHTASAILFSTLPPGTASTPRNQPFAIAYWDRSQHPSPEAFWWTCLDLKPQPSSSSAASSVIPQPRTVSDDEAKRVLPHFLAIVSALQNDPAHRAPGRSVINDSIQVGLSGVAVMGPISCRNHDVFARFAPHLLAKFPGGAYHSLVFQTPGLIDTQEVESADEAASATINNEKNTVKVPSAQRDTAPAKHTWPAGWREKDESRRARLKLVWSSITETDYPLVEAHNEVIRMVGTGYLHNQPSTSLRVRDTNETVAFCAVRPDGSIGVLAVVPEWRRKGLAGMIVRRACTAGILGWRRDGVKLSAPADGWDGLMHAAVARENTASYELLVGLGGREMDLFWWFGIDLGVDAWSGERLVV